MPHLKHIGLTNFRVFGERTDIALAPLTILTGPNSSGKSSVLKAIQLLQENIADIGHLNFSHGEHKLGNFDMALNRDARDKTMVFTLPFEYKDMPEEMYMDWIYEMDMSNPLKYGKLTRLSVCLKKDGHEVIGITPWDKIDIDLEYFHLHRPVINFWINMTESALKEYLKTQYPHDVRIPLQERIKAFKSINSEDDFFAYVISLLKKIKEKLRLIYNFKTDKELTQLFQNECFRYELVKEDVFDIVLSDDLDEQGFTLNSLLEKSVNMCTISWLIGEMHEDDSFVNKNDLMKIYWELSKHEDVYNVLNTKNWAEDFFPYKEFATRGNRDSIYDNVGHILKEAFGIEKTQKQPFKEFKKDNFYCLEAVRATTQRIYTWQSQGTSFNQDLLNFVKSSTTIEVASIFQRSTINHFLKEFGIGNELKINVNDQGIGAFITIDDKPLADLGYGVTQLLPILVKIFSIIVPVQRINSSFEKEWFTSNKQILYIEEPETNLHPKLQSKLADLFVFASKLGLQIIVETHSEYLIRKLQYLTAKKEITPEMTVIHYFYDPKEARPEGEPQVKQINIQTDGRLTGQFGAGFYDETARLMTAILTGETLN